MSAHRSQASGLYGVLRPKKRTGSRVGPLLYTSVDSQGAGPMPTEIGAGDLSDSAVRAQLDSILASAVFSRSPHLRRFLSFIVEQTLAGQGPRLKEAVLAHELYGKGTNFDAGNDPETLRGHTLTIGADLQDQAGVRPDTAAPAQLRRWPKPQGSSPVAA